MYKILIIEDEKEIREAIEEVLSLNGYKVNTAENGKEGLDMAIETSPDLVLCDVLMPKLNGWQTIEAFRANSKLKYVPFVFLSAMSSITDFRKGMNLGADDYLSKPFDPKELISTISIQLGKVAAISKQNTKEAIDKLIIKEKSNDSFDGFERTKQV
ncbi:MAG: response regulator [Flavobacteriales bacterium]|nr:response regulator [Flavobacteriales bacterium]